MKGREGKRKAILSTNPENTQDRYGSTGQVFDQDGVGTGVEGVAANGGYDAGGWGDYADAAAGKIGAVLFAGCVAGVEGEGKEVETGMHPEAVTTGGCRVALHAAEMVKFPGHYNENQGALPPTIDPACLSRGFGFTPGLRSPDNVI